MNKYATRDFTPTWLYHLPFHCFWAFSDGDYITDDFGRSIEVESLVYGVDEETLYWLSDICNEYPEYRVVENVTVEVAHREDFPEYRVIR